MHPADLRSCSVAPVIVFVTRSSPTGLSAATTIGSFVTVGAGSILRSCAIHDNVKIGKKCIVMEGAVVRSPLTFLSSLLYMRAANASISPAKLTSRFRNTPRCDFA
eukprot:2835608-Pyramimonas_sp.AAC.1